MRSESACEKALPRTRFEIGAGGAGADQPRLRINPLEGGRRQETRWFGSRFGIRSTGARDLPRQPEQGRNADSFEDLQNLGIVKDEAAEPEGDDEHHDSHPDRNAQKGRIPRTMPTLAPVAVNKTLLGPGVPAATIVKIAKAII